VDIVKKEYNVKNITYLTDSVNDIDNKCRNLQIDIAVLLVHIRPGSVVNEVTTNINFYDLVLNKLNSIGIKKIVYFSSGGRVYGNYTDLIGENFQPKPLCAYGITKQHVENYIESFCRIKQMDYLIFRPGNPYGGNQNIVGNQGLVSITIWNILKNAIAEIWGDGTEVRDYIYITDFCNAVELLLKSADWNQCYNIGCGKGVTTNQIIQTIKDVSGLTFSVNYHHDKTPQISTNILNISKMRKKTDYNSKVSLTQGILTTYNCLAEQLNREL